MNTQILSDVHYAIGQLGINTPELFKKFNALGDARLELILNHKIAAPILFIFKRFPRLEEMNDAFLKAWMVHHRSVLGNTNNRGHDDSNDHANVRFLNTFRIAVMYWKYAETHTTFTNKAFATHMDKYCDTLPHDDSLRN